MILNLLLVIDIILALTLIGLVLLQHGKGADAGAAFGSGASATVFGARGAQTFLSQTTKWVAILWFATTLGLVYLTRGTAGTDKSVVDAATPTTVAAPATMAPTPATAAPAPTTAAAPGTAPAPSTAAPAGPSGG